MNRFAEWLSEEHKARQNHAIESSSSVPKPKVFEPMMRPDPSTLPLQLDPEVGGEEKKIMTKSAEDLEKSKDEANGGIGVLPSIFEHGHEQSSSSSFDSSPYIPIPSSPWSFFDNPFELPQPDISFTNPPGHSDPPKFSAGYSDPPKHSTDSPGHYYFNPPKCSIDSPGYPDTPHPLSYYYYIGFPETQYASSLHPYNHEMHPETKEASSYTRNYSESSDHQLLLLPTPITPKFYSYGNSYSPFGGQSRLPQEYEDYPHSQIFKSASSKIDDYFQLFS
jgi:hypothetical protein